MIKGMHWMKCRKCGYEIPLKDIRCPNCNAKLYSFRDTLFTNIQIRISYGYFACYLLFGTLLPQYVAWQFQFILAKVCAILLGIGSVLLPFVAIHHLSIDKKRNQRELFFQYVIVIMNIVLSIFYYDMLIKLIEYIMM